jgi:PAS domain S-box-containing protein
VLWSHTYGRNPDGTIDNITSLGMDISETRRTRRELQRLTLAIEQSPMSVVITDPEGTIEWVSSGFTRISGYSLDEARGKNPRILNSGLMAKQVYNDLWRTIKAGRTWRGELLNRNKYGTLYWESVTITPVLDSAGRITDYLSIKQDITERIAAEQEMKKLSAAIFQSVNSIAVLDVGGVIEYVNPRFCDSTGRNVTELIGRNIESLLPQQTNLGPFTDVIDEIRKNKVWRANFPVEHSSGQQIWIRCSISPITHDDRLLSYLLVGEDISHEMETLGKLTESEKMAAVGMLAAGVSHEFKNLLGGIMGNASYALEELEAKSPHSLEIARDTLGQVIEISERANQVAMSLLTYSKTKTADLSHQNLPQLIANTVSLIENEMRSRGIELVTYADQLPTVAIDAGKIQQLILNLLINAEHAITGPGVITIAVLLEGSWVRVRIGDTGCGIPKENISRIFDPFFSTKGVWGKDEVVGSGMGLAICRNVAREHGGDIAVESRVGVGSTFTLSLPLTRSEVSGTATPVTGEMQKQVVLFSLDHAIYSRYFPEACELGIELTAVDSIAFMDRELTVNTFLLICDARFTGKVELFKVIEICRLAGVPYVMINCGAMEYQLSHLYDHARENFSDFPEFSRLLKNAERSHTNTVA